MSNRIASAIWQATKRDQISLCAACTGRAELKPRILSGQGLTLDGRMASCASSALPLVLNTRAFPG